MAERLARQLQWLIGIRLIVITSILAPTYLLTLSAASTDVLSLSFMLRYAGLCYLVSIGYLVLLLFWRKRHTVQAYIQFCGDLLLVTYLVHHSGGMASPFSMLYLVVISIASVLLRRRAGLAIAGIAWLLYAGLLVTQSQGWIGPLHLPQDLSSLARLAYQLGTHLIGFYAVAFLTSYLGRDVSRVEQELAETIESLAELEVLHRDIIESMTSGLITADLDGKVISVNPAGRTILRTASNELVDRPIFDTGLIHPTPWRRLQSMSAGSRRRVRYDVELQRGEERLWIGYSVAELRNFAGERRGFTLIFQDLTEAHRLREQVRINDRMAAVGELAAGLAHEIGNPLAAISGSVQLLSNTSTEGSQQHRLLDIIRQESDRLDRTIKDFLRYARPKPRQSVMFDVAKQLDQNIQLLRNSDEVHPHHQLELQLEPASASLEADPDQISQIFWNLARNALRAMPAGGTLTVRGRLEEEQYVIHFQDTGKGMNGEERANLFHPFKSFFDGGSGIGMAIVYQIVEEHGGEINVESTLGEGTSIEVALPLGASQETLAPRETAKA